ncbi:MAG TPA: peptidoglycan-binding protein [Mycobacterium sp.]|nr:peptidoglycan-binding protein [Mycobacterium sp.]
MTTATTLPTLAQGDTGPDVAWAQYLLVRRTLVYEQVDSIFGAFTRKGVILFQDIEGLDTDGIVGPLTWAALGGTRPRPRTLSEGSNGALVSSLQTAINKGRGDFAPDTDPVLVVDGIYGPHTAQAVRGTQSLAGIPSDGVVSLQTWAVPVHAAGQVLANLCGLTGPGS